MLIDTNVAIHLRDGDPDVRARFNDLPDSPALSLISMVELSGGAAGIDRKSAIRRARLAVLLKQMPVLDFDMSVVDAYAQILSVTGFSRRRVLDRLIAATALVHDLTLVTINGADFHDIPDLKMEVWPSPA